MARPKRNYQQPNLQKRPSGLYYARFYVPRQFVRRIGRYELVRSLGTSDFKEARRRILFLNCCFIKVIHMAQAHPNVPGAVIRELADQFLDHSLEQARTDFLTRKNPPSPVPGFSGWDEIIADDFEEAEKRYTQAVERKQLSLAEEPLRQFLATQNAHSAITPPPDLKYLALKAMVEGARYSAHLHHTGDLGIDWKPLDTDLAKIREVRSRQAAGSLSSASQAVETNTATVSDLIRRFIAEQTPGLKERSLKKHEWQLEIAERFFGSDTPIKAITRRSVGEYRELLAALPANFSKRFPKHSLEDLAKLPAAERQPLLKPAARNPYLGSLVQLFVYAQRLGYCDDNPATGMQFKDPERARDKRHPFSLEQLQNMFSQPIFTGCDGCHWHKVGKTLEKTDRFWAPLIALLTGMRRGEIFALTPDCLKRNGSAYYFDIRDAKTQAGIRQVPLHPTLIRLGAVDFIGSRPRTAPIFGEASGDGLTKFFKRFLRSFGLSDRKLTFHSFRHTFIDAARAAGLRAEHIKAIVGHTDQSATGGYGNGYGLDILETEISKITFWNLSLEHLAPQQGRRFRR